MQKIILDTDIGDDIDDALALAFAIMSGKLEILGVTTVFRNAEQRAELACCLLEALGRTDIPVYSGIGKTLLQSIPDWEQVAASHRPRQMEVLKKQQPSIQPMPGNAVDFIIDTVMAGDGGYYTCPHWTLHKRCSGIHHRTTFSTENANRHDGRCDRPSAPRVECTL